MSDTDFKNGFLVGVLIAKDVDTPGKKYHIGDAIFPWNIRIVDGVWTIIS